MMATTRGGTTESKAEQAGDSTSLEWLARGGLIAYGVVHLLVGWLALQIAWGGSAGTSADTSGALTTLADQPFGKVLLWVVAVGLVALALWQASQAIWGYRNQDGAKRVRKQVTSGAKAAVYAALAVSAALVALGSGSSSSQSQEQATTGVLAWPGGRVLVVAAGLAIIGVGVASIVKGAKESFTEEINTSSMSPTTRTGVLRLGQVGYIAKGVALSVVGACSPTPRSPSTGRPPKDSTAPCRPSWPSPSDGSCSLRSPSDSSRSACSRSCSRATGACDRAPRRRGVF
jgi:hypothetical protein